MLDLPPSSHCNTFLIVKPSTPLLIGLEFAYKSTHSILSEWNYLSKLKAAGQWDFDLQPAFPYLNGRNRAVVVTDTNQKITWVSQGFRRMTGYGQKEAYNKHPNFLQGEKTSVHTRQLMRQHLADHQPFSGTIVNYRKSGEAYVCAIQLFPVYNQMQDLVNFIALEKEELMDASLF